ncbi:MAG: hypothetical protein RL545_480, partial [Actinomycetota bacterium]
AGDIAEHILVRDGIERIEIDQIFHIAVEIGRFPVDADLAQPAADRRIHP